MHGTIVKKFQMRNRQVIRNQTVRRVCDGFKVETELPAERLEYVFQHIIVDDEHKLLYCYIPKVACSNWKRVFLVLSGKYRVVEEIHHLDHSDFKFLSDYSPNEAQKRLQNYFKFMFVREPLDRLVSAYRSKFHKDVDFQQQYGRQIIRTYRDEVTKDNKGEDVTLKEFLQYYLDSDPEKMNEHWKSYESLCQPCHIRYNFIGQFEHLKDETAYLLDQLDLSEQVYFPYKQSHYEDTKEDLWNQIPSDLRVEVEKTLQRDRELFQYTVPEVSNESN